MNDETTADDRPVIIPRDKALWLRWLLVLAILLLLPGLFLPLITLSKFVVVSSSFSIVSGVLELLRSGQVLLFVVVAGFSILLPLMKIAVLFKLLAVNGKDNSSYRRYLHLMHDYGRWAMLDVMVVAVLIVTVKLGAIASIQVHYGLYLFGASVLLIMIVTNKVVALSAGRGRH